MLHPHLKAVPERVNVLCLLGRAQHGKTTVGNYLRDIYGAEITPLAGPLKRVAKTVMGFSDAQLYGDPESKETVDPRYGMSPRQFMQLLGTDGLRKEFGADIHVKALLHSLQSKRNPRQVYVVDDTRFPDEAEAFALESDTTNGAVIKIVCTDAPRPEIEHASESAIDLVPDHCISATVYSSRRQGPHHLCQQVERALHSTPRLAEFAYLLGQRRKEIR